MPQLIEIERVKIDPRLYPRVAEDWQTVHKYKEALETGATFPPIEVAAKAGELFLIDGMHRISSHKQAKRTQILAEIKTGMTDAEIFARANNLNCTHGRSLSMQERIINGRRLVEEFGFKPENLENIICMKLESFTKFSEARMTLIPVGAAALCGSTTKMAELTKKAPLNDVEVSDGDMLKSVQERMGARDQRQIFAEALGIVENGLVDTADDELVVVIRKLGIEINKRFRPKKEKVQTP